MKKLLFFCFIMVLGCQSSTQKNETSIDTTQNESKTTENQDIKISQKDTTPPRTPTTFAAIKDRFLHQGLELSAAQEENFFWLVVQPSDTTGQYFLDVHDLDDLGFNALEDKKYPLIKAFLYDLHTYKGYYLVGLATGSEVYTQVHYYLCDTLGKPKERLFFLGRGGDMGHVVNDFAYFKENSIDVHKLDAHMQRVRYKHFTLNIFPETLRLKADTMETHRYEDSARYEGHKRFNAILKKHKIGWKHME